MHKLLVSILSLAFAGAPAVVHAESRLIDVRGAKLHVETLGSGAPIIFLHGGVVFFALIYRSLPAGQLAILPGTGHGTFSVRPDLANLITREFLERP